MPDRIRINSPGAPANQPHTAREGTAISDYHPVQQGADTAPPVEDADPHPSDEGHPYDGDPHPGTPPRYLDIRPNPDIHTGTPEPRPDNADHGPKYSPG
jgi:hypothetical protein